MAQGITGICKSYLKANWHLALILLIFFLAGIVFGAIGAKSLSVPIKEDLSKTIANFFAKVPGTALDIKEVVKGSMVKNLYVILGMYILGLSVVGSILVPILIFTRGFTLGFTIGFLVYDLSWKGLVMTLVSIIPQNLIFIPAILLGGLLTLTFSLFFTKGRLMLREFESGRSVIMYSFGMLIMALITVVGCLLESYVTPSVIKYTAALLF